MAFLFFTPAESRAQWLVSLARIVKFRLLVVFVLPPSAGSNEHVDFPRSSPIRRVPNPGPTCAVGPGRATLPPPARHPVKLDELRARFRSRAAFRRTTRFSGSTSRGCPAVFRHDAKGDSWHS